MNGNTGLWMVKASKMLPPHVEAIFPTATVDPDRHMLSKPRPSWYIVYRIPPSIDDPQDKPGLLKARGAITKVIDDVIKQGIPSTRIVVSGL